VKQVGGICPLCDHAEEEDSSYEEETGTDETLPPFPLPFSENTSQIRIDRFPFNHSFF
jgi:hypothetical protein